MHFTFTNHVLRSSEITTKKKSRIFLISVISSAIQVKWRAKQMTIRKSMYIQIITVRLTVGHHSMTMPAQVFRKIVCSKGYISKISKKKVKMCLYTICIGHYTLSKRKASRKHSPSSFLVVADVSISVSAWCDFIK